MRQGIFAIVFGLSCVAAAADTDGEYAPPERWTHPRGPASGSGRSHARAPGSFGGLLWTFHAKKSIESAPVTWDGVIFLLDRSGKETTIVALDARNGKPLARTSAGKSVLPRPAAHDRSIFLIDGGNRLVQYRLKGRTLSRRWSYDAGDGVSAPRILAGEIYVTTPKGLLRLRAGSKRPVWSVAGGHMGEPSVFGDHVYALARLDSGELGIEIHNRSDGQRVGGCVVAARASGARGGRLVVGEQIVAALVPPEKDDSWALLSRKMEKGPPALNPERTQKLAFDPLGAKNVLFALTDKAAWSILTLGKRPVIPLASGEARSDLVKGATAPIRLDGAVCCGTWAGDINSNLVLWHLNEHERPLTFQHGVRFNAVPADHERLLVVAKNGKSLYAIGPEEIGK